jgi:hypothetical protein
MGATLQVDLLMRAEVFTRHVQEVDGALLLALAEVGSRRTHDGPERADGDLPESRQSDWGTPQTDVRQRRGTASD